VLAWDLYGFYRPVVMGDVYNTIKGGRTVPLKFNVFAAEELTDVLVVKSLTYQYIGTGTGGVEDPIEETVATGGTVLRYDETEGQFIYNWKTPTRKGDYVVVLTTQDGSTLSLISELNKHFQTITNRSALSGAPFD
jgi:hypothetical protein